MAGRRVDVLSLKGGVGKTTLAVLLAQAQAAHSGQPVLIVDADLTGTCLGDLLQGWANPGWHELENLAHLVCGPPESLSERLRQPPLYALHGSATQGSVLTSARPWASQNGSAPGVWFCPSHAESEQVDGLPPVSSAVLDALLAHESGARWVAHVIARLIAASETALGGLGGVLVDHGPGMGALQRAAFDALTKEDRQRGLLVTSCDAVDLLAMQAFDVRVRSGHAGRLVWCVNRVASIGEGWQSRHRPSYVANGQAARESWEIAPFGAWFHERALPMPNEAAVADANAGGRLGAGLNGNATVLKSAIDALRARLFDDAPPAA